MRRWSLVEMVEYEVIGFLKEKDIVKDQPLESVEYITRSLNEDEQNKITLSSKSYNTVVLAEFFEPCRRIFKGAEIFLGKARVGKTINREISLIFFALNHRFFSVLMPIDNRMSDIEKEN